MPKKGVEPAGLRRWRLAHRAKKKARRSARSSGEHHAPGFAASYVAGKTAVQILSPVTDDVLGVVSGGGNARTMTTALANRFTQPAQRTPWIKGVFSSVAQGWADRKFRVAGAMAQKSVTALAPEAFALGHAILDNNLDPVATHDEFVSTTSGYSPASSSFSTTGQLRTYLGLKYGGVAIRKAASAIPAFGKPIRKALNQLGLTL